MEDFDGECANAFPIMGAGIGTSNDRMIEGDPLNRGTGGVTDYLLFRRRLPCSLYLE